MVEAIEIHEHSPAWAGEFRDIGMRLRAALGELALRIDHIGSTSIAYAWRRDNPELTKRYFRELPGARRTHVHVRRAGSWHEQFALLFRDYVRCHRDAQLEYEAVKRELAGRFRLDRQGYTDAKDAIFWTIMQRADRWAAATGWQPPAPDA
jgi:GrpB-like predicted nucleotidyltransferase (UPF0157 family)